MHQHGATARCTLTPRSIRISEPVNNLKLYLQQLPRTREFIDGLGLAWLQGQVHYRRPR
ncbi:hypothetical protein BDR03DRAFT_951693, partial [Suillus americanus]